MYNVSAEGDAMNIDMLRLKNGIDKEIIIDTVCSFPKEMLKGTDVEQLDNVEVKGKITRNVIDEYLLSLTVKGVMIIPCAVTLEPVSVPFDIKIEEVLNENTGENEEKVVNIENTIDILPIIWENILVEIPMRVVSPKAETVELKGDGWELKHEDSAKRRNSGLEQLKDLIK